MVRYMTLPIRFVHGELNELFSVESATRSSEHFRRINPNVSALFGANGTDLCHHIVPGYGHLDLLIGVGLHAPHQHGQVPVYQQLTALFDEVWQKPSYSPKFDVGQPATAVVDARFPSAGPWISPAFTEDGKRYVNVAFVVDDLTQRAAVDGTMLRASALVHGQQSERKVVPLEIVPYYGPLAARDGFLLAKHKPGALVAAEPPIAVRIAKGRIATPEKGLPLRAECITYSELQRPKARKPLAGPQRAHRTTSAKPADSSEKAYTEDHRTHDPHLIESAVARTRQRTLAESVEATLPFPSSISEQRRRPARAATRWLNVPAGTLDELLADDEVRIAIGSCRYPGLPYDRDRSDQTFERMVTSARADVQHRPHVTLMLGDQIYADASANVADPMSAIERFHRKHLKAFTTPWMRRLLATSPVVMTPDDHEYTDNYPSAGPLYSGSSRTPAYAALREFALRRAASDAVKAFQFATCPAEAIISGCTQFSIGEVRVIVVDTRSQRESDGSGVSTLSNEQRDAIRAWIGGSTPDTFQLLCSGSVVLPSLVEGSDPANSGKADSWKLAAPDQVWLLELLARTCRGRFAVVSGDYHVSACTEVLLSDDRLGLAIVAPPFYAPFPYANARPSDVSSADAFALAGGTLTTRNLCEALPGSGYGLIRLRRDGRDRRWRLRFDTDLDPMDGTGWTGLRPMIPWS